MLAMLFLIYGTCCVIWLSSNKRAEEGKTQHSSDVRGVSPDAEMKSQRFLYDHSSLCGLSVTVVEGDWTTQSKLTSWKGWRCNILCFLTTSSHRQLHPEEHIWCWLWFKLWDNYYMPSQFFLHSGMDVGFKTICFWTYIHQQQLSK